MTEIEARLTDYLRGYTRRAPENLQAVLAIPKAHWQRLAHDEQQRRAARLLEMFSEEELQAIAKGEVSLPDLATALKT